MKTIIVVLALLVSASAFSQVGDFVIEYRDSFSAADTNGIRVDTVFTEWIKLNAGKRYWFGLGYQPVRPNKDTNFATDSLALKLQYSFDRKKIFTGDTIGKVIMNNTDSMLNSTYTLNCDSVLCATYIRGMFIYRDSVTTGNIKGNVYLRRFMLWINQVLGNK